MEDFYAPISGIATFGDYPTCTDLETLDADMTVLGIPYDLGSTKKAGARLGPRRIREVSGGYSPCIDGAYDYEQNEVFLEGSWKVVDAGDVLITPVNQQETFKTIEQTVRKIIDKQSMPIIIGGDSSVSVPVIQAYDCFEDVTVIRFGSQLEWKDTFGNQKYCTETTSKRLSEMSHISNLVHIGLRGTLCGSKKDFDDAKEHNAIIIGARQANEIGKEKILEQIPKSKNILLDIHIDAYDCSQVLGCEEPKPSGLDFYLVDELVQLICQNRNVIGMNLVGCAPELDPGNFTVEIASSSMIAFMGYIQKSKEVKK